MIALGLPSIARDLETLWLTRWNQDIDAAERGLAELKAARGWQTLDTRTLEVATEEAFLRQTEVLLLEAYLLRARGRPRDSGILIARIYKLHRSRDIVPGFHLTFEVGLDAWLAENYQQALEYFILADERATNEIQRLFCLSNLLLCLEALDLERDDIERRLETSLNSIETTADHLVNGATAVRNVREQLQAYVLRKRFYQGTLRIADLEPFQRRTVRPSQAVFFAHYVHRLPYFTNALGDRAHVDVSSMQMNYLWQGSYRIRTLEGIMIPSDRHLFRSGDAIDRAYLWTWMLMAEDPRMSLEKIEATLASLEPVIELDGLSVENRLLLRNATRWLLILAPRAANGFRALVDQNVNVSSRYRILDEEFRVAESLASGVTLRNTSSLAYGLRRMIDDGSSLPLLSRLQDQIRGSSRGAHGDVEIVVDMRAFELNHVASGRVVRSRLLCELYRKLASAGSASVKDLDDGIETNRRKVYNLIARARCLSPLAEIGLKGDDIVCAAPDALKVRVLNADLASRDRRVRGRIMSRSAGAREKVVSLEAARVFFTEPFSRDAIEKSFRVSKAKACRVLASWLDKGILEKIGNGKSLLYKWRKS